MSKPPASEWTLSDLVDLEFFLARDAASAPEELSGRDRELFRTRLAAEEPVPRRVLLRRWLELRREGAGEDRPLPGEVTAAVLRPLAVVLAAAGAFAGGVLAWGVLSYGGDRPINLFAALGLLVALPLLATVLSAVLPALRLALRDNPAGRLGRWLAGPLLAWLRRRARSLLGAESPGGKARAPAAAWGTLRARGGLYAPLAGWLAVALLQLAGLCFSLGVLLTVLLRGWFSDLAFSWQTTASLAPEQVHALARTLAAPWSAFCDPPLAHPTLEQVAGSRVFLKEGLQPLASGDLQSWWPFLLWAILFYGVLPRLVLLATATAGYWRARRRLTFRDARCEALLRRLRRPVVSVGPEQEPREEGGPGAPALPAEAAAEIDRLRLLVPAELLARPRAGDLPAEVQAEFGARAPAPVAVTLDEAADAGVLETLAAGSEAVPVLLVLEGWQPCINATLEYLRALRRAIGRDRLLVVALIGREAAGRWGTPTPAAEFGIWRQRLATLGDPGLLVRNWGRGSHA